MASPKKRFKWWYILIAIGILWTIINIIGGGNSTPKNVPLSSPVPTPSIAPPTPPPEPTLDPAVEAALAKQAVLLMDEQIYAVVLNSDKIIGLLQDGIDLASDDSATLLDLYDLAKAAKDSQSKLFSALLDATDDTTRAYVEAAQLYIMNGYQLAENLINYIDTNEMKYLSQAKECVQSVSDYTYVVLGARMQYLYDGGFTDAEVGNILTETPTPETTVPVE